MGVSPPHFPLFLTTAGFDSNSSVQPTLPPKLALDFQDNNNTCVHKLKQTNLNQAQVIYQSNSEFTVKPFNNYHNQTCKSLNNDEVQNPLLTSRYVYNPNHLPCWDLGSTLLNPSLFYFWQQRLVPVVWHVSASLNTSSYHNPSTISDFMMHSHFHALNVGSQVIINSIKKKSSLLTWSGSRKLWIEVGWSACSSCWSAHAMFSSIY